MLGRTFVLTGLLLFAAFPLQASAETEPVVAPLGNDLGAIQETIRLPRATMYNDRDGDKVFDSLEERFLHGLEQDVIVTLHHDADFHASVRLLGALGIQPIHEFSALGMVHARLRLDQVQQVARLDAVRQIEWSQPGQPELDTATLNFGARAVQDDLAITGDLDGNPQVFTSKDIVVAILDSGFDGTHVDFAGKFLAFLDTKDGQEKAPYDSGYHGTHVAGIVGGLGHGRGDLKGVAPGAAFVGIKIEGAEGGSKAGSLMGVDWILKNREKYGIRISTISYGFGTTVDGTDALEIAFDKLFEAGVLPFKSTGNSGPEPGTVTIPGGARGIIAVANMFDPGRTENPTVPGAPVVGSPEYDYGFHLSGSSSRGPTVDRRIKPDLAAPGSSINSVANGTQNGYRIASGTSMASPFAAGSAALVLAADPSLSPSQVRDILFATAEDWGPKGPDPEYGVGRLNTLRAVQTALVARLMREQAPAAEVAKVLQVQGPNVPFHVGGVLTDALASTSFEVKDPKQPLAVTLIHHAPAAPATLPPPAPRAPPLHVVLLELKGPDGSVVKRGLVPTARQQVIAFIPEQAGKYTIEAKDLAKGAGLIWDVSAGLPPVELPPLPEIATLGAAEGKGQARPLDAKSGESVAQLGIVPFVLALACVLLLRGRAGR